MLKGQYFTVAMALAAAAGLGLIAGAGRVMAWATPAAGGYYQVEHRGGAEWLLTPEDRKFFIRAWARVRLITAAAPRTDLAPAYVDQRAAAIFAILRKNGFNTLGGGSDADLWRRGMPFVETLDFSEHMESEQQLPVVNVYAPDFVGQMQALAEAACGPQARDRSLIGYLADDGLGWDPAVAPSRLLAAYLALPPGNPARERAQDYLRIHYNSEIKALNRAWGTKSGDFTELTLPATENAAFAADAAPFGFEALNRYLQTAADAIHAADPNHLFLGAAVRLAPGAPPKPNTPAALIWQIPDVASIGLEPGEDAAAALSRVRSMTPRPLLVYASGCGPASAAPLRLAEMPGVVGYVWDPAGDWDRHACLAQAATAWSALNRQAVRLYY